MLKKTILALAAISLAMSAQAADKKKEVKAESEGYVFTTVKEMPITSIKSQGSTGTCWCFSSISFLESEAIRNGAPKDIDLSEMFIVSNAYSDKAEKYVRLYGNLNFGAGSAFGDAIHVMQDYGLVPNSEMPGLNYGSPTHNHGELDAVTKAYVSTIARKPMRGKLSTAWKNGFNGIVDAYLGEKPETFVVDGKEYTPKSYVEALGLNADDYVSISSFTHHPFYSQFVIEVPDNWRFDTAYNLPLDEMVEVMDNAIENGYTIAWASDVSEKGFSRNGLGIVPDVKAQEAAGSDEEKWIGKSPAEKADFLNNVNAPGKELNITQEMRQIGYDEQTTTDDHGMHIYGIAKDQNGTKYYMIKNSWGESGKYKGIWYISEPFVRYKTLNIVVNKAAIPASIKAKMGIK